MFLCVAIYPESNTGLDEKEKPVIRFAMRDYGTLKPLDRLL